MYGKQESELKEEKKKKIDFCIKYKCLGCQDFDSKIPV